jgi:hypothetical protein
VYVYILNFLLEIISSSTVNLRLNKVLVLSIFISGEDHLGWRGDEGALFLDFLKNARLFLFFISTIY